MKNPEVVHAINVVPPEIDPAASEGRELQLARAFSIHGSEKSEKKNENVKDILLEIQLWFGV